MKKYLNRLSDFKRLAKSRGLFFRIIGTVRYNKNSYLLFRIDWKPAKWKNKICFAGMVHGDEASGVWGIRKFLQKSELPKDKWLTFFPIVNPSGYERFERRTAAGADPNRNWFAKKPAKEIELVKKNLLRERFSAFISFHEGEWRERERFYIHYYGRTALAKRILKEISRIGMRIDRRRLIDGYPARGGLIKGFADGSFEDWMYRKKMAKACVVPEIPSGIVFRKETAAARRIIEVVCGI